MGQLSQASPRPSPSASVWSAFATVGQLSQTLPAAVAVGVGLVGVRDRDAVVAGVAGAVAVGVGLAGVRHERAVVADVAAAVAVGVRLAAFATVGQLSQTSPRPSPSPSAWSAFDIEGQLSQALPTPSPSPSAWSAFGDGGSCRRRCRRPSPSPSAWSAFATAGQLSQALPRPSPSLSAWSAFATSGQLSQALPEPSPSPFGLVGVRYERAVVAGVAAPSLSLSTLVGFDGGAVVAGVASAVPIDIRLAGIRDSGQLSQASPRPSPSASA